MNCIWFNFGEWRSYWFPAIAPYSLIGYINKNINKEINHKIWYYTYSEEDFVINYCNKNKIDYLLFSVNIGYFEKLYSFLNKLKKKIEHNKLESIKFVFGNNEFHEEEKIKKILSLFPYAFIVVGEGEFALEGIMKNNVNEKIPNLFYIKRNEIQFTYQENFKNEKYISPKYNIEILNRNNLDLKEMIPSVETSRGCNKVSPCTFCSNSISNNNTWRKLNSNEVLKNLIKVTEFNDKVINFISENFLKGIAAYCGFLPGSIFDSAWWFLPGLGVC